MQSKRPFLHILSINFSANLGVAQSEASLRLYGKLLIETLALPVARGFRVFCQVHLCVMSLDLSKSSLPELVFRNLSFDVQNYA